MSARVSVSVIHGNMSHSTRQKVASGLRGDLAGQFHVLIMSIPFCGVGSNMLCGLRLASSVFIMDPILSYEHFLQVVARHWRRDGKKLSIAHDSDNREVVVALFEHQICDSSGSADHMHSLLQSRVFVEQQHRCLSLEPPEIPRPNIMFLGFRDVMNWQGLKFSQKKLSSPPMALKYARTEDSMVAEGAPRRESETLRLKASAATLSSQFAHRSPARRTCPISSRRSAFVPSSLASPRNAARCRLSECASKLRIGAYDYRFPDRSLDGVW